LTQREFAERVGVHRRSVQEWEIGSAYPSAERLEAVVHALLDARGLTPDHETVEAEALWSAVQREAPHARAPLDVRWFASLVEDRSGPSESPPVRASAPLPDLQGDSRLERERRQDWGEAPDTTGFIGRAVELQMVRQWVRQERGRLLAILGMGGIGKTSLAAALAQEVAPAFERVYWRTLRDAPPSADWLAGAIGFLSDQQLVVPTPESERLTSLLQLLRQRRCLLVLDNSETLFEPGQEDGDYRHGMAGYGRVFQVIGEASHQSCLIIASREQPPELAALVGEGVRILQLDGFGVEEAQVLLSDKQLVGSPEQWADLTARLGGNGLALKVVGESIREPFAGDIGGFLGGAAAAAAGFVGGMRRLLTEQVERSSANEQHVLRVLAVEREPLTLRASFASLAARIDRGAALEALEGLRRRSLIERVETSGGAGFTLQSVVLDYVTDELVEAIVDEIQSDRPGLLVELPLFKASRPGAGAAHRRARSATAGRRDHGSGDTGAFGAATPALARPSTR
jgi:transcriptional regulator with XRE-family HTH domain